MRIYVQVVEPIQMFVKVMDDDSIALAENIKDATSFNSEEKAFTVRKQIISQLGDKTQVTFKLC